MQYVIIGSSAAATSAAKTIRKTDPEGSIIMLSKDTRFFSRCQLHLIASNKRTHQQANFMPEGWQEKNNIQICWNTEVVSLDPQKQCITTSQGDSIAYDRLLIAMGSRSWLPPIPGLSGKLTFGLRDLSDADDIWANLSAAKHVTIVGAGLVGCELAAELAGTDKVVNIVELAPYPLPMQLEEKTGHWCNDIMQKAGIHMHCGNKVVSVTRTEEGMPQDVVLDNGQSIKSDLIVAAAGVRANIEWLAGSGVTTVPHGIPIDQYGRTNCENVYAAGDVTVMEDVLLHAVMPSPIWPTAVHQGRVAGANMAGGQESMERNTGFRSSVHLLNSSIVSLGPVNRPAPEWEKIIFESTQGNGQQCMKVLYFDKEYLQAAVLCGDITNAGVYTDAIINHRALPQDQVATAALAAAQFGTEKRCIV